ncbi:hypothetical protein WG66_010184, partial [Moniliophthora roreri]
MMTLWTCGEIRKGTDCVSKMCCSKMTIWWQYKDGEKVLDSFSSGNHRIAAGNIKRIRCLSMNIVTGTFSSLGFNAMTATPSNRLNSPSLYYGPHHVTLLDAS